MELQTISRVSKQFSISTRTLRYYEEIGLIRPIKKADSAYRAYDYNTVVRLQQIIVLRKLRIPLRQIAEILKSEDAAVALNAFSNKLAEIEDEITALYAIKRVIQFLLERLHLQNETLVLLDDKSLLDIVDSLTVSKINFKEEKTMDDLSKQIEKPGKLTDRDVRIVYLPPATVAAAHYIGEGPEGPSSEMLHDFIKKADLAKVYPAARCFGFNHPNPGMRDDGMYGYEFQVTIPDEMVVPAPMEKKRMEGGLYAAYMILMDEIDGIGWNRLFKCWLDGHEVWEGNMSPSGENMNGLLEEHLNILNWKSNDYLQQVDLLLPIKKKG